QAADRARRLEAEQRRKFQRLSVGLVLDRGTDLGDRLDPGRALLWLARGLQLAGGQGNADPQRLLRSNPAGRQARAHPRPPVVSPASGMAWTPDGKTLLTWGPFPGAVKRWNARTGAPAGELPHNYHVLHIAFGGDGQGNPWRIATASEDRMA